VGIEVVEVDRPNRQARHRAGKFDSVDAVAAARAALSGVAVGRPKSREGLSPVQLTKAAAGLSPAPPSRPRWP
jgi:hypothetical protein